MDENFSYLFGLFQADGNLYEQSRNRGRLSLEILKRDEQIILILMKQIEFNSFVSYRSRTTNFGFGEYVKLSIYDRSFREKMKSLGFPVGKKDELIAPPIGESFEERDYIRGIIDGDGSLGLTGNGFPFISLVTKSEAIKEYYINYIYRITNKMKNISRNKRDNVYNIMVNKEDAQKIVSDIYYDNCICLERKRNKSKEVLNWIRPITMKKLS